MSSATLACPRCGWELAHRVHGELDAWACPARHGLLAPVATLRREMHPRAHAQIERMLESDGPEDAPCPRCRRAMRQARVTSEDETVLLDACATCRVVWFDADELDRLRGRAAAPKKPASAPQGAAASGEAGSGDGKWMAFEMVRGVVEFASFFWI